MKSCFPLDVRSCECMSQASACFISMLAYFRLPGMDGRWGRGCHSYHLTYELIQTKVDIDMLQMLVRQSNVTVKFFHWTSVLIVSWHTFILDFFYYSSNSPIVAIFIHLNINLSFIYSYSSKLLTHLESSGWDQMALVYWFIACYFAICKPKAIGWRLTTHVGL